ncbi:hypothetical protein FFLO_05397 [Filobasidium floriforme]|uniref:Uncharacterized protein n=1 Tax=Filobasidium floriforme TaxID=5210 RepID=A0A8K0JGY3_9TREE|nr:hypothetical protein FFLO_05397 [Filobasidium floriforme]
MTKGAHTRSNFEIFDQTLTMVSVALVCIYTAGDHKYPSSSWPTRQAEVRSTSTRYIKHLTSFAVTQRRPIFLPELADLSYPLETYCGCNCCFDAWRIKPLSI